LEEVCHHVQFLSESPADRFRYSSKLKEVNIQIRKERTSNKKAKAPSPPANDDDFEGSIVKQPRSNVVCASCKTRESVQWWKAPKGLSSTILCNDCGISWRKYADFTKPVIREESVPATKSKAPEKREGTPLNGPSAKRSKVWTGSFPPPTTNHPKNKSFRQRSPQRLLPRPFLRKSA
jgi:hypothetical protein